MPTANRQLIEDSICRIERNSAAFGEQFPTFGSHTTYSLTANDNWLAAFWPGMLWLAYSVNSARNLRAHGERLLPSFDYRLRALVHITHDLGFLYTLSARAQWQITQEESARTLALKAADMLAARYRTPGGYIQAWGSVGDPKEGGRIIIDTMMNLPLLFWATDQTGDPRYHQIARHHADITAEHLVRADDSSAHTFFFDQNTGTPLGSRTHQGYADDSMWARGQAWTIFGFAVAAQWTGSKVYRDIAQRAAERFMAELPNNRIPRWDLRLPPDAPQYTDTSAGAIAASGMLRLASQLASPTREHWQTQAKTLVAALANLHFETDPDGQGLLRGGTYHAHKQLGVNQYFICGDYFFLEALLMLDRGCPDFWGPAKKL